MGIGGGGGGWGWGGFGNSVLDPDIRARAPTRILVLCFGGRRSRPNGVRIGLRIEQSGFAFRPVCVLG